MQEQEEFLKPTKKQLLLVQLFGTSAKLATVEEDILQGVLGEISAKRLERILNRLSQHLEYDIPNS